MDQVRRKVRNVPVKPHCEKVVKFSEQHIGQSGRVTKDLLSYFIAFAAAAAICICLLVGSALIPREAIRDNMLSTAETVSEEELFIYMNEGLNSSMLDRYADSILLNIAYHYDSSDPLRSVMTSAYYFRPGESENQSLLISVQNDLPAEREYIRYWHGSAVPVRVMHLFTDLNGMIWADAAVIAVLTLFLLLVLIKNRLYAGAVAVAAGLAAAGVWYVPFCLEYTWVFMIMPASAAIAVLMTLKGDTERLGVLFIITGVVTNFFDFLTTETLTLLIPLMLVIYTARKRGGLRHEAFGALKLCVLWGTGYAGMWALKWGIASAVLGENVMKYVTGHISERIGGLIDLPLGEYILTALWRNIVCLFPVCLGSVGIVACVLIAFAAVYVCFVYRRKGIRPRDLAIYLALGAVPFIRLAVLHNHAFLHNMFTYRALAATVAAVVLVTAEIIDRRKDNGRRRKA